MSTLWEAADWHWDNLGAIWQTESKTMQCYEKNNEITAASRLLHESDFTRIPLFVMIWNMHSNIVNQNDNSWHQMLTIIQNPKENAKLKCCQKGAPYKVDILLCSALWTLYYPCINIFNDLLSNGLALWINKRSVNSVTLLLRDICLHWLNMSYLV